MDRLKLGILFWALLALGFSLSLVAGQDSDEEVAPDQPTRVEKDIFHRPVRLTAADGVINSGPFWGHSSPWVVDVDGDGANDLVVGDFSGFFRFYRNEGTNKQPRYAKAVNLKAGGVDAQVPIY
jgi:hypothetical protein